MRSHITLRADWGRYKAGHVLTVWQPDVELADGVVDPQRAATLIARGIAVAGVVEQPPTPTKKGKKE